MVLDLSQVYALQRLVQDLSPAGSPVSHHKDTT